jgi:hypothetical protein
MDDYRSMEGTNQSSLKKILTYPSLYVQAKKKSENKEESEAEHFIFGRVVDLLITGQRDEFEENFVKIPDETKCSDTVKLIVDDVFDELEKSSTPVTIAGLGPIILKYCNHHSYQSNWKDDTRIDKIIKDGGAYFELLCAIRGKTPITETEYAKAVNCTMAWKSDEFTKKYCVKEKGVEFWDKVIVKFKENGRQIKGELDRVVINHNYKTITPIDFKTTGQPIYFFNSDFWKYRYDIQAMVYHRGLLHHPEINKLIDDGYKLLNFKYIVVEKDLIHRPVVFNVTPEVLFTGLEGGERSPWKLEGFRKALERLDFAEENNAWDFPMEYYKKGELDIRL